MSTPVPPRASPYRAPLLLALLSLAGLVSALVGDGVFDAVSWVAFAIVFATLVAMPLRRRTATGSSGQSQRRNGLR